MCEEFLDMNIPSVQPPMLMGKYKEYAVCVSAETFFESSFLRRLAVQTSFGIIHDFLFLAVLCPTPYSLLVDYMLSGFSCKRKVMSLTRPTHVFIWQFYDTK